MIRYADMHTKGEQFPFEAILDLLSILESLFQSVPDVVRSRWQARSIGNFLTELVMYENKESIRRKVAITFSFFRAEPRTISFTFTTVHLGLSITPHICGYFAQGL